MNARVTNTRVGNVEINVTMVALLIDSETRVHVFMDMRGNAVKRVSANIHTINQFFW